MRTIGFCKAQPMPRCEPIESLTIIFGNEWKTDGIPLEVYLSVMDDEATKLHDALVSVMSGGMLSRLAAKLATSQLTNGLVIRPQDVGKERQ